MIATQTTVLLLGNSEQTLEAYKRELSEFRVLIHALDREAEKKISEAAIVVLDLAFEASESSREALFESVRRLNSASTRPLIWFLLGSFNSSGNSSGDAKAFQALVRFTETELLRWHYLKKPLLEGELGVSLSNVLREQRAFERESRFGAFRLLTSSLRGIGHELANFQLRVMSRTELAQMEKDPKKLEYHLEKLVDANEAGKTFLKELQAFSRVQFRPQRYEGEAGKISALVQETFGTLGTSIQERACEADPALLSEAFRNLLLYLKDGRIEPVLTGQVRNGQPGVGISISVFGVHPPASDLNLSIARWLIEVHGGDISVNSQADRTEVLIWLPWGL